MNTQNQIKRTLSECASIEYVRELLASNEIHLRSQLAEVVCEHFGFHDPRGKQQVSGSLKALRRLEEDGHFVLPEPKNTSSGPGSPQRLAEPVALPLDVPDLVDDLCGLKLILVTNQEHMRIRNELMINEHPQGAGPLVGRQLRYLIGSCHGFLGGLGFAAAALQLAARDEWIGWDADERLAHLDSVVGMSRFLIRPSVKCHNLASKVLSMSMAVLPVDFEQRYGYRPYLVESFVDTDPYFGTCYKAGNWIEIGKTKGGGRQDRFNQSALSRKTIYVYPIDKEFRRQMGLSADAGLGALTPDQGLESGHWAENEFGGAPLGGARLSKRLVSLQSTLAVAPNGLPLGVLHVQCIAPKGKSEEEKRPTYAIPIEEKKTFPWIEHHRDLVSLSARLPQTRLIHVCDREADFFEMFDEQRRNPCVPQVIKLSGRAIWCCRPCAWGLPCMRVGKIVGIYLWVKGRAKRA